MKNQININMDTKCKKCGSGGATGSGFCLECIADSLKPSNPLLESIANQAADDLKAQFKDANDDLLAAIHKAQREAQLQEAPLKFNIGFRMSFDLQKSTITNTLSWNVKQSLEISHQIEDPNQVTLSL
jgi:hypothetical protein